VAISIMYWLNYTKGQKNLSSKSENAVNSDRVLKFFVRSGVRTHWGCSTALLCATYYDIYKRKMHTETNLHNFAHRSRFCRGKR